MKRDREEVRVKENAGEVDMERIGERFHTHPSLTLLSLTPFAFHSTEFVLSEAGDVTWSVTDSCDALPLFSCQMYELYTYQNLQCYGNRTLLRFAAYNGHIIEFRVRAGPRG